MQISFNFPEPVSLLNRSSLKKFIAALIKAEGHKPGSLAFVFCSDNFLLKINKHFLKHDYYTDIITFDLSETDANLLNGEIYISVDTVRDNARRFDTSLKNELHRVMFHGVLHLCGYMDKTKAEKLLMRQKEDHYLQTYFSVPRGTSQSLKS